MNQFEVTLDMSADDVLLEMDRLLAVEFSGQERVDELVSVIAQLDENLSAVQESLAAIEANRPAGADVAALGKWTTEKTSTDALVGTLSDKSTDHKAELAELKAQKKAKKKQIFERVSNALFVWKMEQQRAKNAEITRIEALLREVQSSFHPYSQAVHLELDIGHRGRAWLRS